MKVFVGIFACLVAVQAHPLFGLDDTLTGGGGSDPTSAVKSLGSGGGLPLPDFSSIILKVFSGSDGTAAFNKFFAILLKAMKANPNGAIPNESFLSSCNDAAKNDPDFPFNFFNNIRDIIPGLSDLGGAGGAGGADNGLSVFLNIFIKLFSSNGTIPASVTSKLSDLSSQGDITPDKFASHLKPCNAEQSNSDSHSDNLDYKHDESTSLSKKSADESNDSSSFPLN